MSGPPTGGDAGGRPDGAAERRRRRRDEAELASSEATFAGVLAEAAATGTEVHLTTTSTGRHTGRVVATSAEVVQLDTGAGTTWLRWAAVAAVTGDGLRPGAGGPAPTGGTTVAEVLAGFAGTRAVVTVGFDGGGRMRGEVEWCGVDAAGLRGDGGERSVVYVASVREVSSSSW